MLKNKLINRKSKPQLIEEIEKENFERITCSFYRYTKIENPEVMRLSLLEIWLEYNILGRVYIAFEGINAQISVPEYRWDDFILSLEKFTPFASIPIKKAVNEGEFSFIKLIIRVKNKLVADGLKESDYNLNKVGGHLSAKEFNDAMEEPDSVVVDMRNYYESEIGHFKNAICPDVATFKEALPVVKKELEDKKNNKILMYCTGGIRCEKASAYLKHNGFNNVYQLDGGIIEYSHQIKKDNLESKFRGKNYVFDGRMNEDISSEIISYCHQCDAPSSEHTNCNNQACHILFIQCSKCFEKYQGCCSYDCKNISELPIEEQRKLRKNLKLAAPLKQFQTSVKPKLKDLIKKNKLIS